MLHVYVGQQRAHFFIVIARLNGKTKQNDILFSLLCVSGGMLNFNCALMLVLMLRKHITWLRSKGGSVLLPLDNHIDIHKTIGIIIMIETALHTIAHFAYLCLYNLFGFLVFERFLFARLCLLYLFLTRR